MQVNDYQITIELINDSEHFMLGSMRTFALHSLTASAETSDFFDLENLQVPTSPQGPTKDEQDLVL